MKSRLWIILGIIIISGSVAVFAIIDVYQGQIEWREKVGGLKDISSIPSAQEFLKMDCKELEHLFPEFPSKEAADAWNTRMHECITKQEPSLSQTSNSEIDKKIASEMENLQQMSCDEIIEYNSDTRQYQNSDNRKFAREKVLECSDTEESFAVNATCEELYIRYDGGQEYWFEDHKQITENRLAKCPG
jgi:hypothetical protein